MKPDEGSVVCPEFTDVDSRIDEQTRRRDEIFYKLAQNDKAKAFETSPSSIPPQYEDSSVLEKLISHTQGE